MALTFSVHIADFCRVTRVTPSVSNNILYFDGAATGQACAGGDPASCPYTPAGQACLPSLTGGTIGDVTTPPRAAGKLHTTSVAASLLYGLQHCTKTPRHSIHLYSHSVPALTSTALMRSVAH